MRKLILGLAAATLTLPILSVPAFAQKDEGYEQDEPDNSYYDEDRDRDDARDARDDDAGDGEEEYRGETWQGEDGRVHCRRSDGTTGLIVGAGAGALVGRGIDTRGERGTGTILGAIAGAAVGRAIERGARCR